MQHTYYERLCAGLRVHGWTLDLQDRSKYEAFTKAGAKYKMFVGRSGALRQGECASRSHSIGAPSMYQGQAYGILLKSGEKALAEPPTCDKCGCGSNYHYVTCTEYQAWVTGRIEARAELARKAEEAKAERLMNAS